MNRPPRRPHLDRSSVAADVVEHHRAGVCGGPAGSCPAGEPSAARPDELPRERAGGSAHLRHSRHRRRRGAGTGFTAASGNAGNCPSGERRIGWTVGVGGTTSTCTATCCGTAMVHPRVLRRDRRDRASSAADRAARACGKRRPHRTSQQSRLLTSLRTTLAPDAERSSGSVGLLFCDLDGFKKVNDRHGHLVGDAVLIEVGRRLLALTQPPQVVSRLAAVMSSSSWLPLRRRPRFTGSVRPSRKTFSAPFSPGMARSPSASASAQPSGRPATTRASSSSTRTATCTESRPPLLARIASSRALNE